MKYLVEEFNLKEFKSENNNTFLSMAVLHGLPQCTKWLLEYGYDVNHKNDQGFTPLSGAISINNHEIATILIQNDATFDEALAKVLAWCEYTHPIKLIDAFGTKHKIKVDNLKKVYRDSLGPRKVKPIKNEFTVEIPVFVLQSEWSKILLGKKYELFPAVIPNLIKEAKAQIDRKSAASSEDISTTLHVKVKT